VKDIGDRPLPVKSGRQREKRESESHDVHETTREHTAAQACALLVPFLSQEPRNCDRTEVSPTVPMSYIQRVADV